MRAALALSCLAAACYSPQLPRCAVRCLATDTCPADLVCGGDNHCHEPSDTAACPVDKFTITVQLAGDGGGIVMAQNPVFCEGTNKSCPFMFDFGTMLSFSAMSHADSRFVTWGGVCTADPCMFSVDGDRTVVASFALQELLTVAVVGGSTDDHVVSSDNSLYCDTTTPSCSMSYDHNMQIELDAVPANDGVTTFDGWSGGCSGTGPCMITMSAPISVTANFSP